MLQRFRTSQRKDDGLAKFAPIIDNLNHILNTKKGFGSYLADFGIGDYNAYRSRDKIIETIIAEIKENIAKHEPRVRLEEIKEVESDTAFRIRFEMRCVFLDSAKPIYVVIDSLYNRVTIEEA